MQYQEIVAALCLRPDAPGQWLTGLFVAPAQCRQGLTRRLSERALARADGLAWLFCHPELGDFYRRLGFTPTPQLAERLARCRRSTPLIALCR